MLTSYKTTRLWIAGLVCLVAASASAQERTAEYGSRDSSRPGEIQQVFHPEMWYGPRMNYYNAYNGYGPYQNNYPNYNDPSRGYVAYSHTHGTCCNGCWADRWNCWKNNCAAGRANFGARCRCSMAFLRPLTYWDAGCQLDIIAVNPGYAHPSDMNQGYAAQGYGSPVSVPQAPNVRSNYNYSWGLPASRLTPTSFPVGY